MVTEFEFPDVGEGVTEGTLLEWQVDEGDAVEEDDVLAQVETDKAVVDVPSPTSGTVSELHANPGDVIKVGEVIVTINGEDGGEETTEEAAEETAPGDEADEEEAEEPTDKDGESEPEKEPKTTKKTLAAPSTRKFAREKGIEIDEVEGTGPGGRVTKDDVRSFAETEDEGEEAEVVEEEEPETEKEEAPEFSGRRFEPKEYDFERWGDVERTSLSGTRRSIANRTSRSKYTAPHVTATDDADVSKLVEIREKEKQKVEEKGVHLTYTPFVVKAVVAALKEYPLLNASIDEKTGEIVEKDYYNIGMAVATDDGLLVPNIKNADGKTVIEIAREINQLAERARSRDLELDDMRGGTFTISNWGSIGGKYGTPVINYPEVGILGTGVIDDEPVVVDGEVEIRKMMPLSLSFDHRIIDGAYAAEFMNEVIDHLEDPDLLLIEG
ncbi:dihydrolipoamide acetyltransferase family protein [Halorutilales archaeon Cl-col2-1]